MAAAHAGATATVIELLNRGADPNFRDATNGSTPLLLAAAGGHAGVVEALLGHGADPASTDREGRSALLYSARRGHGYVRPGGQEGGNVMCRASMINVWCRWCCWVDDIIR